MGFRSTLTSTQIDGDIWPQWFRDKYGHWFASHWEVLATHWEVKTGLLDELPKDVHRALTEAGWFKFPDSSFDMVWLHECGGLTKVQINADGVLMADPGLFSWESTDSRQDGNHCYCYGCTDLRESHRYAHIREEP